jgi:hypothetical protein
MLTLSRTLHQLSVVLNILLCLYTVFSKIGKMKENPVEFNDKAQFKAGGFKFEVQLL